MGRVLKNLEAFIESSTSGMKQIEDFIFTQQTDLHNTVNVMSLAIENLSKFSRALVEDPTLFLRSRKVKK